MVRAGVSLASLPPPTRTVLVYRNYVRVVAALPHSARLRPSTTGGGRPPTYFELGIHDRRSQSSLLRDPSIRSSSRAVSTRPSAGVDSSEFWVLDRSGDLRGGKFEQQMLCAKPVLAPSGPHSGAVARCQNPGRRYAGASSSTRAVSQ